VLVPQFAQLRAPTGAFFTAETVVGGTRGDDDDSLPEALPLSTALLADSFALVAPAPSPSSARRDESALLYVGQPEQADEPPVPSQRPSPGHVPPAGPDPFAFVGAEASPTSGEPGLDESSPPADRVFGSAGEAVRLRDMSDGGRGTRRDFR